MDRVTQIGLVGALTEHYGSPGCLADHRRQFERTVRQDGEHPSKFAVAIETLAVKAFGDMGLNSRTRLIRDWFIASHPNCDLRRHLDSVPPVFPFEITSTDVECGRAMPTPMTGELLNQHQRGLGWCMW